MQESTKKRTKAHVKTTFERDGHGGGHPDRRGSATSGAGGGAKNGNMTVTKLRHAPYVLFKNSRERTECTLKVNNSDSEQSTL